MRNLKENSIRISEPIVVCWPQYDDKEETLDMTDIGSKFNGAYCTNNSTICFVVDHEVFVTPYTQKAMSTIGRAGLVRGCFYVPFSNGDYPKHQRDKWIHLREAAQDEYYREFENDCAKWCDERNIGKLADGILERCFKMPRKGVPVKHPYFVTTYYPACGAEMCLDCIAVEKIGHYCFNNGRVAFVYRDGHTYVAKGGWILNELRQAGYRESSLFVPFSNGERITDPSLAAQWERIPKK